MSLERHFFYFVNSDKLKYGFLNINRSTQKFGE